MKEFIRTIDGKTADGAEKVRADLNKLGFYALTASDNTVDVYVISDRVYMEHVLKNYLEKGIAFSRGHVVVSQWQPLMKYVLLCGLLMVNVGCNSFRHMTNTDNPAPVADVHGVWDGQAITVDGVKGSFFFILSQNGAGISGIWNLNTGAAQGTVTGTLAGQDIEFTLSEGTSCNGHFTGTAHVDGVHMNVSFAGDPGCTAAITSATGVLGR